MSKKRTFIALWVLFLLLFAYSCLSILLHPAHEECTKSFKNVKVERLSVADTDSLAVFYVDNDVFSELVNKSKRAYLIKEAGANWMLGVLDGNRLFVLKGCIGNSVSIEGNRVTIYRTYPTKLQQLTLVLSGVMLLFMSAIYGSFRN